MVVLDYVCKHKLGCINSIHHMHTSPLFLYCSMVNAFAPLLLMYLVLCLVDAIVYIKPHVLDFYNVFLLLMRELNISSLLGAGNK